MELQATGNQGITNRSAIAKFVHDVADMEVRVFTLRRAAKRIRKDVQKKKEELGTEIRNRENECEKISNKLKETNERAEKKKNELEKERKNSWWLSIKTAAIVGLAILPFIGMLISFDGVEKLFRGREHWLLISGYIVIFILMFILMLFLSKTDYAHQVKKYTSEYLPNLRNEINTIEKEHAAAHQMVISAQTDLQNFEHKTIPALFARAEALEKDAKLIEEKLRQCYELDIVKPSYRKLVCVVILDEIFTNDKADTMREAMLLCDTEIRHAELIGKLDEVIHSLKTLASTLQYMTHVLENINSNVSLISQDVYRIAESQDRIAYATESIKQSAANADYYIEQKRMGVL